ncbi:MAG: glycosyltransferase [Bacteroidetes bacterium]|nr:MAG: glycosyltransferase [Bacteroidota bacterium]
MEASYPLVYWIFKSLFWVSVLVVLYSYLIFPLILFLLSHRKKLQSKSYELDSKDLPKVSLLIAAYNEQDVIEQKVRSIFNTTYPTEKIEVLIGSDNSDDNTNSIVDKLCQEYPSLKFFPFKNRRGKGNVINDLFESSAGQVVVFTDANVMLEENTLFELVRYFNDPKTGLVDTRMVNTNMHHSGISFQERFYISREVYIKQYESILWGTMMGPFGGCFAIRRELFRPVPKNFLVDDFYLNMKVLEQGYKCINNLHATVNEDVSNNLKDEFRRKIRISTGNFQNLSEFSHLLWYKTKGLSFCFISHKAIRWIIPFFLVIAFLSNLMLSGYSKFYFYVFLMHCVLLLLPLLEILLRKVNVHAGILRYITHFYSMNLALLLGFFKSLKNIESNVWKPTQRNQV